MAPGPTPTHCHNIQSLCQLSPLPTSFQPALALCSLSPFPSPPEPCAYRPPLASQTVLPPKHTVSALDSDTKARPALQHPSPPCNSASKVASPLPPNRISLPTFPHFPTPLHTQAALLSPTVFTAPEALGHSFTSPPLLPLNPPQANLHSTLLRQTST